MEEELRMYFMALVVIGFSTGICIGSISVLLYKKEKESKHPHFNLGQIHKLIHTQRESLRSLRTDFNTFRTSHERELMSIVRETLRVSPRSVSGEEPNAQME